MNYELWRRSCDAWWTEEVSISCCLRCVYRYDDDGSHLLGGVASVLCNIPQYGTVWYCCNVVLCTDRQTVTVFYMREFKIYTFSRPSTMNEMNDVHDDDSMIYDVQWLETHHLHLQANGLLKENTLSWHRQWDEMSGIMCSSIVSKSNLLYYHDCWEMIPGIIIRLLLLGEQA